VSLWYNYGVLLLVLVFVVTRLVSWLSQLCDRTPPVAVTYQPWGLGPCGAPGTQGPGRGPGGCPGLGWPLKVVVVMSHLPSLICIVDKPIHFGLGGLGLGHGGVGLGPGRGLGTYCFWPLKVVVVMSHLPSLICIVDKLTVLGLLRCVGVGWGLGLGRTGWFLISA